MDKQKSKVVRRERRCTGIRKRITGTPARPRLAVFKSLKHIYVQIIDDLAGKTLCSASTREAEGAGDKTGNKGAAAVVGKTIAKKATAAGIKDVAFDRGGFRFHGRIKALADAAREGGLKF